MKVLCFGAVNIDYTYRVPHFVGAGETLSADSLNTFGGGKGQNQSVALARAGAETYFAGAVGEDGVFLLDQLKSAGANTDHARVLPDVRTGHAIIQNTLDGDNCILLYGGANRKITREQVDEVISDFQAGDFILLQNEINELPYIMEKAHGKGMRIVLNPSPMEDSILKLPLNYVDYFMVNRGEAAQLAGVASSSDIKWEELADALKVKFPSAAVILTLGEKGSVYCREDVTVFCPACPVKAVDTTAAGDTFTGYFISEIIRESSIETAMRTASQASSIAVTRSGAAPSIPVLKEVLDQMD